LVVPPSQARTAVHKYSNLHGPIHDTADRQCPRRVVSSRVISGRFSRHAANRSPLGDS
jgi:hypothetical protein